MSTLAGVVKLTKQELRRQKELLRRFLRYLPTLTLKMRQLKVSLNKIEVLITEKEQEREKYVAANSHWQAVFGEEYDISHLVSIEGVRLVQENLAGIIIPKLICVNFHPYEYRFYSDPLWVDAAAEYLRQLIEYDAQIEILHLQRKLVADELQITTQRVNLFEKIRIPQAEAAIKKISIYLGDQHTAAVVRGKLAKKKLAVVSGG